MFFFKQKTAYEMRISDWSSDVCSSDLPVSQMMESRSIMRLPHPAAIAGILTLSFGIPSVSVMQAPTDAAAASPYTYADIADLATEAPIVLHARIRDATDLNPRFFAAVVRDRKSTRLNSSH